MENLNKTHQSKINLWVVWGKLGQSAKPLFLKLRSLAKPLCLAGISIGILLVVQVLLIGIFDRFLSISPKLGFLFSSLAYVAIFAGLALVGGLKRSCITKVAQNRFNPQPICKLLIIKRKTSEIKI